MKILLHDYGGYNFTCQLARELAANRHTVFYVYSETTQQVQRGNFNVSLDNGLNVGAIRLSRPFEKYSFLRRRAAEIEHGNLLAARIREVGPDVVISANTPLDAQVQAMKACRETGASFVFWLQDAIGPATRCLLRGKLPLVGEAIGLYYEMLERKLLLQSERIILISDDFYAFTDRWRIPRDRVLVIPNWAPLCDLPPYPKENEWSLVHELTETFCFLYTGILGLKHSPDLLLQLALAFQSEDDVRVVVISEGIGADWLREQRAILGLKNLVLLPFQPPDMYPQVLGAADVLVSILKAEAGSFSVPSKVLTYLCARRPLLLAVPIENLAARTVEQACAGLVCSPHDRVSWLHNAGLLYRDRGLASRMGENGRTYAQAAFQIEPIVDQFEGLIRSCKKFSQNQRKHGMGDQGLIHHGAD